MPFSFDVHFKAAYLDQINKQTGGNNKNCVECNVEMAFNME